MENNDNNNMWDQRYSSKDYAFGTEPNDFLVKVSAKIPNGRILCLAEGEGRNAVYLAEKGYDVFAVDASSVGLQKAQKLAAERSVKIRTIVTDLSDFKIEPNYWDGIISIFCHLPPPIRENLHTKVVSGLRPGGVFILEAYTPRQLEFKTGGPLTKELLMNLKILKKELNNLKFKIAIETEREIHEGQFHNGLSAVVQIVAVKQ